MAAPWEAYQSAPAVSGPWQQYAQKDYRARGKPDSYDATEEMNLGEKFTAGVGKAFYELREGIKGLVGTGETPEERENRRSADRPLMKSGAGLAGNVAGNITAFAPLAVIPGANTIGGAAAIGGVMGGLQPGTTQERLTNIGTGMALGGGIQAATYIPQAAQFVKGAGRALAEPLTEEGRKQIIGRALNRAAGGQERQVMQNLQGARELVPGSLPTAGQAAQNAGIAALERTAVATNPAVMELNRQQLAQQNIARLEALRRIAGEGGAYESAIASRGAQAAKLYGSARKAGIDPEMAAVLQPQIKNLVDRIPSDVMREAKAIAKASGENINLAEGSVNGLHYIKKGLDSLLEKKGADALSGTKQAVYAQLRDDFLTVMDDLSPLYAKARGAFSRASGPINEMEIGQELLRKTVRPIDETLLPGKFASAIADPNLARRATGFSGATLEGTMSPQNLATLNAIRDDLARAQFAQSAGRGVGSDTVQKMAMSNLLNTVGATRVPTLLNRPTMLANYTLEKLYGNADREMALLLAESMNNPQAVAALMQGVRPGAAPLPPQIQRGLGILGRNVIAPVAISSE